MSSPVDSTKIHGENPSGTSIGGGSSQQQTPVKRKRLTQACDACRKKKVKCSGENPCNNCTRLGVTCTYLPSTRKRGPRVGLVESLEKRLQQMERLLQPLKEQGLVDESDNQPVGPTAKKPRLNSTESYSVDSITELTDNHNQFYSNQEQDSQSKGYITPSKDTKSHSPPGQFSEKSHHIHSQAEFINYFSPSPQSSSSSSQLSTPAEHQSPVIDQAKICEEPREGLPIKTENSDEGNLIFFGNTSAHPGFRNSKDLATCHAKIKESLQEQESTGAVSAEQTTPIMNPPSPLSSMLVLSRPNELPAREIVEHLASCFFRNVDCQFPMFHEATFKRQLRQGKVSPFLVLSMCAVSARFSDSFMIKRNPPYMSGEVFAERATQMMIPSLDSPSVENVQAFILIIMHTYGSEKGPRSWVYIGMAIRMAQELGLHKVDDPSNTSDEKDSELAFIRKEIRRRTFWACFLLDRFSACALGRPALMAEDDCDVRFPCMESIWNAEHPFTSPAIDEYLKENYAKQGTRFNISTSGIFANFCSIITLLGRISQYVNRSKPTCVLPSWDPESEFTTLENELEEWYQGIRPQYEYSEERLNVFSCEGSGALFASMHLLYYAVVVVLNRPNFVALQNGDVPIIHHKDFLIKSAKRCSTAANQVTSIAADAIRRGIHRMCPFTLYPVFATATIHANDVCSEDINVANIARERLKIHEQYLADLGPIWAMAIKLRFMVKKMCDMKSEQEQSDLECVSNAFFFNHKKRHTQPRTELMSTGTDASFMSLWNRADGSPPDSNVNNMLSMGFSDQYLSPRLFLNSLNDNSVIGDSWTSFLRSQLQITPGSLTRYTRKDNGENEEDYFSQPQDMMLHSNYTSSYIYDPASLDLPVSQAIPEWLPGRFIQSNRQANNKQWTDVDPIIQDSTNQIPLSSSSVYRPIESSNADDQGSSREFKITHSQRTGDMNLDPFIR